MFKGQDTNKSWILPPKNPIFDLMHCKTEEIFPETFDLNNALYNGGGVPRNSVTSFGNAYSRRHISFGDGLINDQDSHREDTVSSSDLPAAERRIGLDKHGEKM